VNGRERNASRILHLASRIEQGIQMKAIAHIAALTLLGLVPALAMASMSRPLQLELRSTLPAAPAANANAVRPVAMARNTAPRQPGAAPLFQRRRANGRIENESRAQSLGRQAMANVFDPATVSTDEDRTEGSLQLKFNKRSNSFQDLGRSYREMCDRVSEKVWDDPNGKRVRFDVAGKPGIGIEIPVGRHH